MSRTKEQVISIIRRMKEMKVENGCTPAEAAHAAIKIQELQEKYQISMLDVESKTINEQMLKEAHDTGRKVRNPGEVSLASAVAAGCDCQLVTSHKPNYTYNFLGFASDVQVCKHLFIVLRDGLVARATQEGIDAGQRGAKLVQWRNNFLCGAAGEIRRRMKEAREERMKPSVPLPPPENVLPADSVPAVSASQVTALVQIKGPAVAEFVKETYKGRLRTESSLKVRQNQNALDAGRKAGREVALQGAVTSNPTPSLSAC